MAEQLTGPDYLMVAADMLSDKPFAEEYKSMLWDAFPDGPEGTWTDAQIIASGPSSEWEATAGLAMMMATMMAIERDDQGSLQEILVTGSRMVGKFARYLKALGKLPPSVP
ncbi:MAG: hypothetical protein WD096_08865 [Actinomycetota bacterium]